ncbi:MAG: hypothetical protein L6300_04085, partial [Syntrophaceae bacterium]|nr:hypothetical protein [Syntrophaceae bacterium]
WLSTFTDDEQAYIDTRFMGMPHHSLTQGEWETSKPASQFLNELATWFRGSKDSSIAERIHAKVNDLGKEQPINKPGYYNGRHYTTYVSDVASLKKGGRLEEAEKVLLELVTATESESVIECWGVAPWYYEELAKTYRKQKVYAKEVAILERFARQKHAPGVKPPQLLERLKKAKELATAQLLDGSN